MNDAHLHMVVNHFPIIGIILGLGVLIIGFLLKNSTIINTAYGLLIVSAIFAAISMATGDVAEEMVEDFPSIGKKIIHEHEEIAEKLALVLYVLGFISVTGLYLNIKKHSKSYLISVLAIAIGILGIYLAQKTGTTGGKIRHTEIRTTSNASAVMISDENEDND